MNVNLTTYCNLKCPYCFATDLWKSAGNKRYDKEISIKNLKKVIDFMKKSGLRQFRMIGGEPTLHTRFEEVYDIVSRNCFTVTIFSNGIISKGKVEFLRRQRNIEGFVINVQHPNDYSARQYEMLNFTLSNFGKVINLGFVIYRADFDAYFIIDLIEKYNLRRVVKWSIAAPCFSHKNVSIKLENHKKVISRMVEHSRRFKRHHIRWYPDTTFMWCLFKKEQLDELDRNVGFKPINLCRPVLEVAPNLTVYRCYGTADLTNPALKITNFRDEKDAFMYFFKKEIPFKRMGVFKECFACELRGKVCGAGCLVHILNTFPIEKGTFIY